MTPEEQGLRTQLDETIMPEDAIAGARALKALDRLSEDWLSEHGVKETILNLTGVLKSAQRLPEGLAVRLEEHVLTVCRQCFEEGAYRGLKDGQPAIIRDREAQLAKAEERLAAVTAERDRLREAWEIIDKADKSEAGSGGEMYYAEVMSQAVIDARAALSHGGKP